MANIINTQILEDGPRLTVTRLTAQLDTSDEAYNIKINPATLSSPDTQGSRKATRVRILRILANIEDGLTCNIWWDVGGSQASSLLVESLEGRLDMRWEDVGGLINNAVSPSGSIGFSTQGWATGLILSYSLTITTAKY